MFSKGIFEKLRVREEQELRQKQAAERSAEIEHESKLKHAQSGTLHFELAKLRQKQLVKKGLQEFKHQGPVATRRLLGRAKFEREQLERELKTTFDAADKPRRVRTVFVVQRSNDFSERAQGEFDLNKVTNGIPRGQVLNETDDETMQRQLDAIAEIFQQVIRVYWQEKLYESDNEILNIVFNENSFYRVKEKKGYSPEYMEKLKQRLIPLGKRLMENMNAFVGTWGVRDGSNMGFYLQGGRNPVITQVNKAVTNRTDLILEDSIFFLHQEIEVWQCLAKFLNLMGMCEVDLNAIDTLSGKVNKLVNCSWSAEFAKCLTEMKAVLPNQDSVKEFFPRLLSVQKQMKEDIDSKSFSKTYAATWSDINATVNGMTGEFSRVIHCKTDAGDVLVIPEICADHQLGIGKLAVEMKVMEAMKTAPELFFPRVSHIVSSSSTEVVERHMLSDVIEHGDSDLGLVGVHVKDSKTNPFERKTENPVTRQKPEKIREIPHTFFGGSVKLVFAKPIELCPLDRNFSHEPFRKKLLMLRKLRERNPQGIKIYDKFILLAILKFCDKRLRNDPYNSSDRKVLHIRDAIADANSAIEQTGEFDHKTLFATFERVLAERDGHTWRILDVTKAMLTNELQERAQCGEAKASTIESRRLNVRWR